MDIAHAIYLHALTPVHSGTGQMAAVIDLPIAREKATGFPLIPASSFKGVLKDAVPPKADRDVVGQAFGHPRQEENGVGERAGALCFTDQRTLCLPVRSYFGTFAYVTCPLVLTRLKRDFTAMKVACPFPGEVPTLAKPLEVLLPADSLLPQASKIYLEDLDLDMVESAAVEEIADGLAAAIFPDPAEQAGFRQRFAIVSNDVFSFLCETATEVTARIVLSTETKTAENLWYEEAVPAETVFYGMALLQKFGDTDTAAVEKLLTDLAGGVIQIGGNASVGRGLCRLGVK